MKDFIEHKKVLMDESLSWSAKGLYMFLATLFIVNNDTIPEDQESLSAFQELKAKKYVKSKVEWILNPEGDIS